MGASAESEEQQQNQTNNVSISNPITQSQFLSWKNRKDAETSARKAESARKRAEDIAAGTVEMNGRELFKHQPWVFDNNLY